MRAGTIRQEKAKAKTDADKEKAKKSKGLNKERGKKKEEETNEETGDPPNRWGGSGRKRIGLGEEASGGVESSPKKSKKTDAPQDAHETKQHYLTP